MNVATRLGMTGLAAALTLGATGCTSMQARQAGAAAVGGTVRTAAATTDLGTRATSVSASSATASQPPCGTVRKVPRWRHVIWIVLENHGSTTALNPTAAPYLSTLAKSCAVATNVRAAAHPSLPNYLAMTSGRTHGVTDDGGPRQHRVGGASIFSQLGKGRWRLLAESMPHNCTRTNTGAYAVRHNPATYYTNIRRQCTRQDRPLRSTAALSSRFTLIVPNQRNNAHDRGVESADRWLSRRLPRILSSRQYRAGRTAVFITYDEAEESGPNRVATVVIAPSAVPGTLSARRLTHYSLLRATQTMLGLPGIGGSRRAPTYPRAFGLHS
ncbi:MAG: alkaline phosphatase family protein [Candidatus Nanopelagicales bacterium]